MQIAINELTCEVESVETTLREEMEDGKWESEVTIDIETEDKTIASMATSMVLRKFSGITIPGMLAHTRGLLLESFRLQKVGDVFYFTMKLKRGPNEET